MAQATFSASIAASGNAEAAVAAPVSAVIDTTDLVAALAVLTADAESPTEAHVTDATDAWAILEPVLAGLVVAVPAAAGLDYSDFDDALGVLTSDGASPTEAHVTDATDAWAILEPTLNLALGPASGGVILTIDTANVGTMDKLRKARKAIEATALGSGVFS
ncbi:MAG: hypothetical protein AB7F22_07860 [Reyranella sp.]|uniref:hypothetical protein n=1 Tax=Reyranella sp. TaxID=1929291 RepID=UPI003D09624B